MRIEAEKAAAKIEHRGKTYYFCAQACYDRFKKDPDKYAS
jgi:Cu+-exporting ATPase